MQNKKRDLSFSHFLHIFAEIRSRKDDFIQIHRDAL